MALCCLLALPVPAGADEWRETYDFAGGDRAGGWRERGSSPDRYSTSLTAPGGGAPLGQWVWPTGSSDGSVAYTDDPGTFGGWVLEAPGAARILDAEFTGVAHRDERDKQYLRLDLAADTSFGAYIDAYEYSSIVPLEGATVQLSARAAGGARVVGNTLATAPCGAPSRWGCPPRLRPPSLDPQHAFNRVGAVSLVLVDPDAPRIALAGEVRDVAARGWTNSRADARLSARAEDGTSGVALVLATAAGRELLRSPAPCDPTHGTAANGARSCPTSHTAAGTVDLGALPDGRVAVTAVAEDRSGERGQDTVELLLDRQPPAPPQGLAVSGSGNAVRATWQPPAQDAGAPLSGFEARASVNGAAFGPWRNAGGTTFDVGGLPPGASVVVEVRSRDSAGNVSAVAAGEGFADGDDPRLRYAPALLDAVQNQEFASPPPKLTSLGRPTFRAATALPPGLSVDPATGVIRGRASVFQPPQTYRIVASSAGTTASARVSVQVAEEEYLNAALLYQPYLNVDRDDRFWPVDFENVAGLEWDDRYLCQTSGETQVACASRGRPFDLGRLLATAGDPERDFLDYPAGRGDITDQAKSMAQRVRTDADNPNPYPSHRVHFFPGYGRGRGTVASFQYWYFFAFNYTEYSLTRGFHEGDFEHIAVLFKLQRKSTRARPRYKPRYVFLSSHDGGQTLKWSGDDGLRRRGTHPVGHASHGTHAIYADCGTHRRGLLPPDASECDPDDRFLFGPRTTKRLLPLRRDPWACWGGRLGRGRDPDQLPVRYGDAPEAPLRQQGAYASVRPGIPSEAPDFICPMLAGASSADAAKAAAGASVRAAQAPPPPETPDGSAPTGVIDECTDWWREPTQPEAVLIVCDDGILGRYVDSGFEDAGTERIRISGPDADPRGDDYPPAIYVTEDGAGLEAARISAREPVAPGVYAAVRAPDGTLRTVLFERVPLTPGVPLRLERAPRRWRLVTPDGTVVARARPDVVRLADPPRPRDVRIRDTGGGRGTVTWRAPAGDRRGLRFAVSVGRSPRGVRDVATSRLVGIVRARRDGRYAFRGVLGTGVRYVLVTAAQRGQQRHSAVVRVEIPLRYTG